MATVYIRSEAHTVMQAIQRQISDYAYHIGLIVYIAKQVKNDQCSSLSIPRSKN